MKKRKPNNILEGTKEGKPCFVRGDHWRIKMWQALIEHGGWQTKTLKSIKVFVQIIKIHISTR